MRNPLLSVRFLFIITDVWYTEQNHKRTELIMEETRADLALERVGSHAEQPLPDSFDVTDYVRELFLNSEEQKKIEKKKLRLMRTCVVLLSLVCAVAVFSAVVLVPRINSAVMLANQTLEALQQVDIVSITTDIDALTKQAADTFQTVEQSAQTLNALDMATLNATIAELKTGVESLNKIDVVTLNAAIENLNATVEPIARFFGKK
jgi:hypothetical protein